MRQEVKGKIVDVENRRIFSGKVVIEDDRIIDISECDTHEMRYILPGFIDSHVHIESSMLTPKHFGEFVIERGAVAIVTDPHEIANVTGVEGINYMLGDSDKSPIKTFFTIPSCVPATKFDVSGAVVSAEDVEQLAASGKFIGLSEMMNVPGVIYQDKEVMAKLESAKKHHLILDGHAPGLRGDDLVSYAKCGISTDHECYTYDEAVEKIHLGMKILIREGSAARNYRALKDLIRDYPGDVMFCTDDAHPDDIMDRGYIDKMVKMSISDGYDIFDVLRIASVNAIEYYKLDVGRLRVGDKADFIVVDDLEAFNVQRVFINGEVRYDSSKRTTADNSGSFNLNKFFHDKITIDDIKLPLSGETSALELIGNEIVTKEYKYTPSAPTDNCQSDLDSDILKLVYINRYNNGVPQVALCKGFGLKEGAVASSVAHDSHNIIAIGTSDEALVKAINCLIDDKGGLIAVEGNGRVEDFALPIAGIMCHLSGEEASDKTHQLRRVVKEMGCHLAAPFMTLSFLALVVIPEIKIGEKGLFCYSKFNWLKE